jgi:hypothetical protein
VHILTADRACQCHVSVVFSYSATVPALADEWDDMMTALHPTIVMESRKSVTSGHGKGIEG